MHRAMAQGSRERRGGGSRRRWTSARPTAARRASQTRRRRRPAPPAAREAGARGPGRCSRAPEPSRCFLCPALMAQLCPERAKTSTRPRHLASGASHAAAAMTRAALAGHSPRPAAWAGSGWGDIAPTSAPRCSPRSLTLAPWNTETCRAVAQPATSDCGTTLHLMEQRQGPPCVQRSPPGPLCRAAPHTSGRPAWDIAATCCAGHARSTKPSMPTGRSRHGVISRSSWAAWRPWSAASVWQVCAFTTRPAAQWHTIRVTSNTRVSCTPNVCPVRSSTYTFRATRTRTAMPWLTGA